MLINEKGCLLFSCPNKKKNPLLGDSVIGFPADYTVLDLETTGLNPASDLIIEFAAVKVRGNKVVDTFQSLCDPGFPIPPQIEAITGITSEMVRFAPNPRSVLPDFLNFVGDDFVVGHNVLFDVRFIAASNGDFKNTYIDTMRIFRKLHPDLLHHRLSDMVCFYNQSNKNAHRALSDCYATYGCFEAMSKEAQGCFGSVKGFFETLKK
jgi:DNA polymerase-3 subunit epsilon